MQTKARDLLEAVTEEAKAWDRWQNGNPNFADLFFTLYREKRAWRIYCENQLLEACNYNPSVMLRAYRAEWHRYPVAA